MPAINLQDVILNHIRKNHVQITVQLTNEATVKGYIKGFDSFVIVLDSNGDQHMIYKHAISYVKPDKPVDILFEQNKTKKK